MSEPELIVTNAIVLRPQPAPGITAFSVTGGRLVRFGSDDELVADAGPATRVVDLHGGTVLPGFVDVHNHHLAAGVADLFELTFPPSAGFDDILAAVVRLAAQLEPDAWISGGSWGSTMLTHLSTESARTALDEAAGGRPVSLSDDSHHNRFVSSRALELAGITTTSSDPVGGSIVRDPETGHPSGLLLETAGLPVADALRHGRVLSADQYRRASRRAIELLHSYGITSFQDAGVSIDALTALRALDLAGDLPAWVVTSMFVADPIFGSPVVGDALFDVGPEYRSTHHRPDFVKIFLDGVPPTRTAAFLEPYLPDDLHGDHFHGATALSPDELDGWLRSTAERGLSAKVHCTGDATVRVFLDAVERMRALGHTDTRYQLAHGQFIAPEDRLRLADLGIAADISPYLWYPGIISEMIAQVLPADRADRMQPNRDLLDLGVLVAGGSDWPVSEVPDPWQGIHGLVTRQDPTGEYPGTLWTEQAVTVGEALEIFTSNGARAMGVDDVTGALEPGLSADFIVIDQNPYEITAGALASTQVLQTWFAGRLVYAV